jgi:hypothetical protein
MEMDIYMIHPYDPNKVPVLFIHGLISSPISWQDLANDLCSDRALSTLVFSLSERPTGP